MGRRMRVVVIGGGTAGFMAAAHVSRHVPGAELIHIFDPSLPPIGVGEGSLPRFPPWLDSVTGLPFEQLAARCGITYKLGIRFEGWGRTNEAFCHNFAAGAFAYHFSAAQLPAVLAPAIRGRQVAAHVETLTSDGRRATLDLTSGEQIDADFVLDARGFPRQLGAEHLPLAGIPTDAALVRQGPAAGLVGGTRAVARPHGWIFVIPLVGRTSYGYVYRAAVSEREAVAEDLDRFLADEAVAAEDAQRYLSFPSFRRRRLFDGTVLRIGNAASFLEPLEATAIGLVQHQLEVATLWLTDRLVRARGDARFQPAVIAEVERDLAETIDGVALFVTWHYSCGSRFDTPFWRRAKRRAASALAASRDTPVGRHFARLTAAGGRIDADAAARVRDRRVWDERIAPNLGPAPALAGFDAASFAQVGWGIGWHRSRAR